MVKNLPNFDHEQFLWEQGFHLVAGVDEVGRGAWAGPVVAAATVWPRNFQFSISNFQIKINDSKRLSAMQREIAAGWIRKNALAWAVGEVGVATINRIGIGKATAIAMRRAINNIHNSQFHIQYLLIDAFYIPYVRGIRHNHQTPIIKGDQKSFSIAAASIIAKVYRDALMTSLSKKFKFKDYKWDKNKGYGTKEHQNEILRNGLTYLHRLQFVETWETNSKLKSQILKP